MNTLYYRDDLKIRKHYIRDESVDLISRESHTGGNTTVRECVSSRNYYVLFKDESGTEADSQIHAFGSPARWTTG